MVQFSLSTPAMTDREAMRALRSNLAALSASDVDFAESLMTSVERRGVASTKQRLWIDRLLARATSPAPERVKTSVGDFAAMIALFDKAAQKLRSPAVEIDVAGVPLRLSVAGPNARAPGTINVATGKFGQGSWFGRILRDGQFEASPREPTPPGMIEGLQRFAADPAGVAAEYGRMTGRCCFCKIALKDGRSTEVGYGQTCAANYGLPWGAKTRKAA